MRENKINFNRTTTVTRLSHVEMHQSHMIPSRLDLTMFLKKSFREGIKKKPGVHKGVTIVTVWKPMQEQCTGYTVQHLELVKHTHDLR